jgi:large subunit ribosomal protein L12
MEYVYAALMLNETGAEINEANLTEVLDAAGVDTEESRVKALVAALEDVNIDEAVEEATAVPATAGSSGGAPASSDEGGADEGGDEEAEAEEEAADEGGDDEEDGDAGEGLGELFG